MSPLIQPITQIEALIQQTSCDLLLVAPFMKFATLHFLLTQVREAVAVKVVTRWRVDEVIAGVSDLEIYPLLQSYGYYELWLRPDLHAKYYRGDQRTLIGSANLTHTALGLSKQNNLELLIDSPRLEEFEKHLLSGSVLVDDTIYTQIHERIATLPKPKNVGHLSRDFNFELLGQPEAIDLSIQPPETWLPQLRHPEKLFIAYSRGPEHLGTGSRLAAMSDLIALDVPAGLDQESFEAYVAIQLLQKTAIRKVDSFLATPQRFGAVRDFLRSHICNNSERADAEIAWQTLMRWLLLFLPTRYQHFVRTHSEIFGRVGN